MNKSDPLEDLIRAELKDALSYSERTCEGGRGEIAQTSQIYYAGRASALMDVLRKWDADWNSEANQISTDATSDPSP